MSDNEIYSLLQESSVTMNKKCPMMVDDITRLDCVKSYEPKTIEYKYTLLAAKCDYTEEQITSIKNNMEKSLIDNVKNKSVMVILTDNDVTFIYSYKDKFGDPFFTVKIYPYQYK
jgi:hypothetical protein